MRKLKKKFNVVWLIAPAVVVVWMLVLYFIKGVYPFGDNSIVAYDLNEIGLPGMYHVYDAWHSGDFSRLFYTFNTAAGIPYGSILTLFQPRFLFLLFWERGNLVNAIAIFLIVGLAAIALSASYSFSKLFPKLTANWVVLVSVMYTFCGFNLLYYTNIDWLDTVLLYPLLITFALDMLKGKSKLPFFIALTYTLAFNTYMAFFVVISLLVFGGLYIFLLEEKQNRKKSVFNLGVGTGAALFASAYSIYGYAKGVFSTARFDKGSYVFDGVSGQQKEISGYLGILEATNQLDIVSIFMFLGMALAFACLFVLWVRFKKHKNSRKYTIFFTITLILFVLQILLKSVMLLWHVGSYQMFPFRNGYMVAFFCCCLIAYYYSEFSHLEGVDLKKPIFNSLTVIPWFFAIVFCCSYVTVYYFMVTKSFYVLNTLVNLQTKAMLYPYLSFAISTFVGFLCVKLISAKKLRTALTFVMVALVIGVNSLALIGECIIKDGGTLQYKNELELRENIKEKDPFCRVNNADAVFGMNYGFIADVPTISNWTHSLDSHSLKTFSDLGFNTYFTFVIDIGGTVFSKALLRITDTVSEDELNKELYDKYLQTESKMNYHKNKFVLPVGVVFDETVKNIDASDYVNIFEYQNALSKSLTGEELFSRVLYKNVIETAEKQESYVNSDTEDGSGEDLQRIEKDVCTATYIFDVSEKSVLYLYKSDAGKMLSFSELKVNGEPYRVFNGASVLENDSKNSSENDLKNIFKSTQYPNNNNSAPLELGVFENETVEITITLDSDKSDVDSAMFYLMDLEKFGAYCDETEQNEYSVNGNEVSLNVRGNKGEIAFVPITFNNNWKCTVNGESVEPVCILGNFMGVELTEGDNDIVMEYSHSGTYINLAIRSVLFALGLAIILIEKRLKLPKWIYTSAFLAFAIIFVGVMVVLYALPIGYATVDYIIGLIK